MQTLLCFLWNFSLLTNLPPHLGICLSKQYLSETKTRRPPFQITYNGKENKIFNGIPDWVYEGTSYSFSSAAVRLLIENNHTHLVTFKWVVCYCDEGGISESCYQVMNRTCIFWKNEILLSDWWNLFSWAL